MASTPSRSHGEGSIYRSDYTRAGSGVTVERWIASVDLGVGPNGKRRRKRITGPTRKAVADKLRQLQREQDAGVDVRKKSITVADVAGRVTVLARLSSGSRDRRMPPRQMHVVPVVRRSGRAISSERALACVPFLDGSRPRCRCPGPLDSGS